MVEAVLSVITLYVQIIWDFEEAYGYECGGAILQKFVVRVQQPLLKYVREINSGLAWNDSSSGSGKNISQSVCVCVT